MAQHEPMASSSKASLGIVLAVLGAYVLVGGITNSAPANEYIAQAFPGASASTISLVTTIPNLMVVFCSAISGAIAGKAIKLKPLILVAGVLYVVGGCITCFIHGSIEAVLATRAAFGIGIGLATPLGMASAIKLVKDPEQLQTVMGWGSSAQTLGAVVGTMLAGFLCTIAWPYTFLSYAVGAIGVILVALFMPDVPLDEKKSEAEDIAAKKGMPLYAWLLCIVILLFMMLVYPLYVSMATVVIGGGIGDATAVGTILSFFTIGGVVAGILYGPLCKAIGNLISPLCLIVCGLGLLVVRFGGSVPILIMGSFVCGMMAIMLIPALMSEVNGNIDPSSAAFASGMLMSAMNLGGFMASGYFALLEAVGLGSPLDLLFVSAIALFVLAVVVFETIKALGGKGRTQQEA